MSKCTAKSGQHRSPIAEQNCPVHRARTAAPPALAAPPGAKRPGSRTLLDATGFAPAACARLETKREYEYFDPERNEEYLDHLEQNEYGDSADEEDAVLTAIDPGSTAKMIEDAVEGYGYWPRLAAMSNPNCPPDLLEASLLEEGQVQGVALLNPNFPDRAIGKIAGGPALPSDFDEADVNTVLTVRLARLGVPEDHYKAKVALRDQEWWTMSPESLEVKRALLLPRT